MMLLRRSVKLLTIMGLMVLALVPSTVFSLHAQDATAEPATAINVTMSEYMFMVEGQDKNTPLELTAGKEYQIHFKNSGTLQHEVLIGSDPIVIKDGYHHDFHNLLLSDIEVSVTGQMQGGEFAIGVAGLNEFEMEPGQELSIDFTLTDSKVGNWEMGCFVSLSPTATEEDPGPGHYDIGMHIPVTVVSASGA